MTIFQKMLVVPILSVVFYFILLAYSYKVQLDSNEQLEQIRDNYLPMLATADENSRLFTEISVIMKDAVLANEITWLQQTDAMHQQIVQNLATLQTQGDAITRQTVDTIAGHYQNYFSNARALASQMLTATDDAANIDALIADVNRYFNLSEQGFAGFSEDLNRRFYQTIDQTNQTIKNLLFWGSIISVALLLLFVIITFVISWATRNSLSRVVERMQALAEGDTDFGQRIHHPKRDEVGALVHWFNQLSGKLEQDYHRIEVISQTDKLTQLHNRTHTDQYLLAALDQAQTHQRPLSLVLFDVDHFKSINDQHGHLVGDAVLQAIAQLLKAHVRDTDFAGRWGGEEFIEVLPETSLTVAVERAEQLRLTLQEDAQIQPPVTASFGVAQASAQDSVDALIKKADDALYQAKAQGRNQVVSHPES